MTPVLLKEPPRLWPGEELEAPARFAPVDRTVPDPEPRREQPRPAVPRAATLDDVISSAWDRLRGDADAACPVCGGTLRPRISAGAGVVGGACRDCGSELS